VIKVNFETIKFELKENGIGILSLNRPEKLNAINFQMELREGRSVRELIYRKR